MTFTRTRDGWLASCICGWCSLSQTWRVLEQRATRHETKCGADQ